METNAPQQIIARPGEASPAQQAEAASLLNDVERNLELTISRLPPEFQSAARMELSNEMSGARLAAAAGGSQALETARQMAARVATVVETSVARAHADALLHSALVLDKVSYLNAREQSQLRRDVAEMLANDPLFKAMGEHMQRQAVEITAQIIESNPETAEASRFNGRHREEARTVTEQFERNTLKFQRALANDAQLEPFKDRLLAADGQLVGMSMMDERLSKLLRDYQRGTLSAEQFTEQFEDIATEKCRIGQALQRGRLGFPSSAQPSPCGSVG